MAVVINIVRGIRPAQQKCTIAVLVVGLLGDCVGLGVARGVSPAVAAATVNALTVASFLWSASLLWGAAAAASAARWRSTTTVLVDTVAHTATAIRLVQTATASQLLLVLRGLGGHNDCLGSVSIDSSRSHGRFDKDGGWSNLR
jgi:hypothetical protein